MSQDEIIAMAKEAGFFLYDLTETHGVKTVESDDPDQWAQLARFAALVAAKEREACAQACDEMHEHWYAIKDTALLNGDVDLSNASSGEPRAAESLAAIIRARSKP